jgi:hypothetical protein
MTLNFSPFLFFVFVGSRIWDPGSGTQEKHLGYATLLLYLSYYSSSAEY